MSSERGLSTSRGVVTFSMCDLLKEIKIRPVLWDKDHVNRMNRFMDWHDVVRTLVPYFDELTIEEQNEHTSQVLALWKRTTNVLMKSLKIKNSGDPKYRPYRYAHHMEFYLNNRGVTLDELGTPEEFEENEEMERRRCEKSNKLKAKNIKVSKLIKPTSNVEENFERQDYGNHSKNILPDDSSYDPILFCETTTQDGFNTTQPVYEFGDSNSNNFECYNEEEDPDQDFFDSIKPILNKLNGAQMLDFKIEFLECLKKYQSQNY
ncbi:uncharacterized protein LOC135963942 [Calliphora vicina]|uniref:uncharacterized protein LOC135963942 n=1 Tax=Calliphora vicina TaxID=7373 RepID=UPI00325AACE2